MNTDHPEPHPDHTAGRPPQDLFSLLGQAPECLPFFDPVDAYIRQLSRTVESLDRAQVWAVIYALYAAWRGGRRIFLCGNGGSAATASHMANDLSKLTIHDGKPRMKAIALTDNVPLMTAWGNDTEFENIFVQPLLNLLEPGDIVLAISASGSSPNVVRAVQVARDHGAHTIAFTGATGGRLKDLVDYLITVPDDNIGRQEDGHMILNHIIATTLRWMIHQDNGRGLPPQNSNGHKPSSNGRKPSPENP